MPIGYNFPLSLQLLTPYNTAFLKIRSHIIYHRLISAFLQVIFYLAFHIEKDGMHCIVYFLVEASQYSVQVFEQYLYFYYDLLQCRSSCRLTSPLPPPSLLHRRKRHPPQTPPRKQTTLRSLQPPMRKPTLRPLTLLTSPINIRNFMHELINAGLFLDPWGRGRGHCEFVVLFVGVALAALAVAGQAGL